MSYIRRSSLQFKVSETNIGPCSKETNVHSTNFFNPQQGAEEQRMIRLGHSPGTHVALCDVGNHGIGRLSLHHVRKICRDACPRKPLHPGRSHERRGALS